MLNVKRGKRKRQIQTTLDDIFKRQRPLTSGREGSSTMTDVVEVNSGEEEELVKALQSNNKKQNQSEKSTEVIAAKPYLERDQDGEMSTTTKQVRKLMTSEELADEIEEFSPSPETEETQEDENKIVVANMETKNVEQAEDESLEAKHKREKVEEKSSETNIETIMIESSQETTEDSENIEDYSSDTNTEIPKEDRDIPVMVNMGTNSVVGDNDELSQASKETSEEKGMSFVVNLKTRGEDNLDIDEETKKDIIRQVWLNLESEEVQERCKAKVMELEECLKEMVIEKMKKEDEGKSADTRTADENEVKSSETSVEIYLTEKDIKLFKARMERRNWEDKEESSEASVEMRKENKAETYQANMEIQEGDQGEEGGETRKEYKDNGESSRASMETLGGDQYQNEEERKTRKEDNGESSRESMETLGGDQDENEEGRETKKEDKDTGESSRAGMENKEGEKSFKASNEARKEDNDKRESSEGNGEMQEGDKDVSFKGEMEGKNESDDETQNYELLVEEESNRENIEEPARLGVEFDTLLRAPGCCGPQQTLTPSQTHTILFRPYNPSQPYPRTYRDKWDHDHVRMPCSQQNKYPAQVGERRLVSRWDLICRALNKPMATSYDLENAILSYHARNLNFKLLHVLLIENITLEEHKEFIEFTLPGIIQMALALPDICTQSLPFLKQQKEHTITMTQQQAACLLACAFLCMFPRRNPGAHRNKNDEFYNFPPMNFARLFQLDESKRPSLLKKMEKLKCILHYFKRVLQQPPRGTISFKRQVLKPDEAPKWHSCLTRLCRLRVSSDGTIEDDAPGLLQVDFANEMVGGGVLGGGCVQEEIRFAICPELIVSRLLTERLQDNECLIVTGAEKFSDYVGYAGSFQWAGNHVDQTPRDSWGRLHTEVVAIDAKPRIEYAAQFSPANIKRELEKAFIGFLSRNSAPEHLPAVATGKWGCGAFNGDPELKSLIQIMASSAAHRDVLYFTFEDKEHARELHEIHSSLKDRDISIGQLWQIIFKFKKALSSEPPTSLDLFGYIRQVLGTSDDG